MKVPACILAFAIAALCTGCDMEIGGESALRNIGVHDHLVAVHARGAPDAEITDAGELRLGGKPVVLSPAQHQLVRAYYDQVMTLRADGIATGKAGAAMAGHAIGSVAKGLAHGDPDSIGPAIDAHAKLLEDKAAALCGDLAGIRDRQEALAAALPAFAPYRVIDDKRVAECHARHVR